ncbi:hypothetical protein [Lysobacter capsici]|uniref:hypothetical protein n=1 Tax=Lysobacter capsici TaxID=435897 RepID=UPI0007166E95|nr:hypothetical protein [Lysobacter capsici]
MPRHGLRSDDTDASTRSGYARSIRDAKSTLRRICVMRHAAPLFIAATADESSYPALVQAVVARLR